MKPTARKTLMAAAAGLVAIGLGGCVYYPNGYYGYGYGYDGGYYGYPVYAAPPVVSGNVTIGGWWWGGHDGWSGGHPRRWRH